MKIKQYIVTYNNSFQVNKCLGTIFNGLSDEELSLLQVFIINNHSDFELDSQFTGKVTVLHNMTRADFSKGHLTRDWNSAIINGFQNLNNPDCDIVIANQDDAEFKPNYINHLIELHKIYDFIQFGTGDELTSYTPAAIKRIGLWDERCCGIGFQEMDYFIRAWLFHPEKSSINDWRHGRILNVVYGAPENDILEVIPSGGDRKESYHMEALKYHNVSFNIVTAKWGNPHGIVHGDYETQQRLLAQLRESGPLISSYIMYPYFENAIETLDRQNYLGHSLLPSLEI